MLQSQATRGAAPDPSSRGGNGASPGQEAAPAVVHTCKVDAQGARTPATSPRSHQTAEAPPLLQFCLLTLVHWAGRIEVVFGTLAAKESGGTESILDGGQIPKPYIGESLEGTLTPRV